MKIINLQNLKQTPINIQDIFVIKVKPKKEVDDYYYPSTPVGYFIYSIRGYANYIFNGHITEILPNSLTYVPTGIDPYFNEDMNFEYIKIYFRMTDQNSNEEIVLTDTVQLLFNSTPLNIHQEISELLFRYSIDSSSYLRINSMFYSLLDNICYAYTKPNDDILKSLPIAPAIRYIRDNYQYEFTTKELADMCQLSEPYFRKLFKDIIHSNPTDYKNYLRINRACQELSISSRPIKRTAEIVGFNSMQYFYKTFKSIVGISPTEYRKRIAHYNQSNLLQ